MFAFIRSMYVRHRITSEKVQSYVPFYITQEEADLIFATPQDEKL